MNRSRIRFGNVVCDIVYDKLKDCKKAVVFAYGLPGSPMRHDSPAVTKFLQKGYMVWIPHYIGTFGSFGICTFENAPETILKTVQQIKGGRAVSVWGKKLHWNIHNTLLAGCSFGGAAALVAGAKSPFIKDIAVLAALTDVRKGRLPLPTYLNAWKRAYCNEWRTNERHWKRLAKGALDLNASDYGNELRDKNVFIAHQKGDPVVDVSQAINLYNIIKGGQGRHQIMILSGNMHLGSGDFADPKIFNAIMKWRTS